VPYVGTASPEIIKRCQCEIADKISAAQTSAGNVSEAKFLQSEGQGLGSS
jgi:hypothetical protein